jgi:KDO2-lipid IV(A) lauroyltransferase
MSTDRRAMHARHLVRALGRQPGRLELERLIARSFASYGRYWVEVLGFGGLSPDYIRTAIEPHNLHHITDALDRGTGCVLGLAHLGNWDVGGAWMAAQGWKLCSVAEMLEPRELYDFFLDIRTRLGMTIYPLDGTSTAARGLLTDLKANAVVALMADRDIRGDGIDVTFFGERTRVPGGPATLALRAGAPLIPTAIYSRPDGRYDAVLRPPVEVPAGLRGREAVAAAAQLLIDGLEILIRDRPTDWHLFQPNWPSDRRASRSLLCA